MNEWRNKRKKLESKIEIDELRGTNNKWISDYKLISFIFLPLIFVPASCR